MDIRYSSATRSGDRMMLRLLTIGALLVLAGASASDEMPEDAAADAAEPSELAGDGIDRPKAMSGMSILGNEEAPKSLVIVPWKSSELGDDISLADTLDDRARPVDKEVFLRELSFYEIRSGE
jgi:hypothetical protein